VFSKTDLTIVFAVVIGALCVALYQAWIQPIQAIVALVILVVATIGLTVFRWSREADPIIKQKLATPTRASYALSW